MPFPDDLKPVWEALYNEAVGAHAKWQAYEQLFNKGQERIDHLNAIAGQFFFMFRAGVLDDVILTLVRLGDSAETNYQENATLENLLNAINKNGHRELATLLKPMLENYRCLSGNLKKRRNKLIAHNDFVHTLEQYAYAKGDIKQLSIPPVSKEEIDPILKSLASFLNTIEVHFTTEPNPDGTPRNTFTSYRSFRPNAGVEALVYQLKKAERYQALVKEGKIEQEYLNDLDSYSW